MVQAVKDCCTSCSSGTGPWCRGHSTSSAVTATCWRCFSLKQWGVMMTVCGD